MLDVESIYFKLPKTGEEGFFVQYEELDHFYNQLHHHPELQLVYIIEGRGDLYIGDSITSFGPKSLFLIGSNQNHIFKSAPEYFEKDSSKTSRSISVFFHEKSLGENFFNISEMSTIRHLIERSKRGIYFYPQVAELIGERLCKLTQKSGFSKFIEILNILNELACIQSFEYLAKVCSKNPPTDQESSKVNDVINYILTHYKEDIELETIAAVAHYSKAAFCKFFKQHTRKTFSEFLNEVRISQACKLLQQGDLSISRIGYESGYNNISHFNRQFKKHTGLTPSKYAEKFKESLSDPIKNKYTHISG